MNRTFEDRKTTKVYAQSKENQAIIKALNKYGRVPEQWELLEEIDRLNNEIKTLLKENGNKEKVIIKQNNIIDELEKWLYEKMNEYKDMEQYDNASMFEYTIFELKELKEGKE